MIFERLSLYPGFISLGVCVVKPTFCCQKSCLLQESDRLCYTTESCGCITTKKPYAETIHRNFVTCAPGFCPGLVKKVRCKVLKVLRVRKESVLHFSKSTLKMVHSFIFSNILSLIVVVTQTQKTHSQDCFHCENKKITIVVW